VRLTVRIVVMRALRPDNLDLWLSEWRRGLDDPEDLFVGLGLPVNVVQAALGELERRYRESGNKKVGREGGGWERRMLGYLEELVKAGVPMVELMRAEHPEAVDELERLLGEERYDVELIYPILERIEDSPSATTVRDAIVEELLGEGARPTGVTDLEIPGPFFPTEVSSAGETLCGEDALVRRTKAQGHAVPIGRTLDGLDPGLVARVHALSERGVAHLYAEGGGIVLATASSTARDRRRGRSRACRRSRAAPSLPRGSSAFSSTPGRTDTTPRRTAGASCVTTKG